MDERNCEAPDCSMPGTICPACEQCFCSRHLHDSSCEVCRRLLFQRSFEHQLGRLVSIGVGILLCSFLFFLLPRDIANGIIFQVAILFLISGSLLLWLGLVARTGYPG